MWFSDSPNRIQKWTSQFWIWLSAKFSSISSPGKSLYYHYLLNYIFCFKIKSNVDEREKIISKQSHQFLLFYFRDLLSQIWVTVYWYINIPISCEYFSVVLCSFNLHFLPPLKTNVTSSKDLSRLKEDIIFMKFKWIFTPRWQREMSRPLVPAQTTMGGISRPSQLSHYSQIWSIRSRGQGGEAESKYIAVMPCQLPHWMSLLANATGTLKQQKTFNRFSSENGASLLHRLPECYGWKLQLFIKSW